MNNLESTIKRPFKLPDKVSKTVDRYSMTLGQAIRFLRNKRHLTPVKVSKRTLIPAEDYMSIERDLLKPSLLGLQAIAKVLRVPVSYIVILGEADDSVTIHGMKSLILLEITSWEKK